MGLQLCPCHLPTSFLGYQHCPVQPMQADTHLERVKNTEVERMLVSLAISDKKNTQPLVSFVAWKFPLIPSHEEIRQIIKESRAMEITREGGHQPGSFSPSCTVSHPTPTFLTQPTPKHPFNLPV